MYKLFSERNKNINVNYGEIKESFRNQLFFILEDVEECYRDYFVGEYYSEDYFWKEIWKNFCREAGKDSTSKYGAYSYVIKFEVEDYCKKARSKEIIDFIDCVFNYISKHFIDVIGEIKFKEIIKELNQRFKQNELKFKFNKNNKISYLNSKTRKKTINNLQKTEKFSEDFKISEKILNEIIEIGENLCKNHAYNGNKPENEINDYFRDMLKRNKEWEIKDQTRQGDSTDGKDAGEIDILICKDKVDEGVVEALKLNSLDKENLSKHINKATDNYNPLGTSVYLVMYVSALKFDEFWNKFLEYIKNYKFREEIKIEGEFREINEKRNAAIIPGKIILSKNNYKFPMYCIAIHLKSSRNS